MKFRIILTASKLMSFMILIMGFALGVNSFMFAVPFASALVLGKQAIDGYKLKKGISDPEA